MRLGTVLLTPFHPTLEDRIEAFNRVGVSIAANIFFVGVMDSVMAGELAANFLVPRGFISIQLGFAWDVGAISAMRTQSTWKLRAEPPRSTRVSTVF